MTVVIADGARAAVVRGGGVLASGGCPEGLAGVAL
jgi:hypothetical protein